MINLLTVFWLLVAFFAVIGFMRGWSREVVATSGVILSLFAINQFGETIVSLLGASVPDPAIPFSDIILRRRQFWVLAAIHLTIAFFSYQGAAVAGAVSGGRFSVKVRDNLQEKLLGAVFGALNGYLIIGTLWSFLEYQITPAGYVQLLPGQPYAFDPIIIRPAIDSSAMAMTANLPLPLLAPYLPFVMVAVFLFVIIVMI